MNIDARVIDKEDTEFSYGPQGFEVIINGDIIKFTTQQAAQMYKYLEIFKSEFE